MTAAQFAYLRDLDMDAVQQPQVDAIAKFANLWLASTVPNQPLRMNSGTLAPELGQGWFKDAVAAWNAIKG